MSVVRAIQKFEGQLLTRQILLNLLSEYARPNDKISELTKQEIIIPIKRGLYIPGPAAYIKQPEPFLIANHLLGPSYISIETALSHWRLIPERVFETSSGSIARSKVYQTPVGRFSYTQLPLPYYSFGQQQLEIAKDQFVLIATPEKALCDKIVTTSGLLFRSVVQIMEWMIEDMRIEKEMLRTLRINKIRTWLNDSPKKESLKILTKALESL